jgi:anthranilate phosphoribosyltransferase
MSQDAADFKRLIAVVATGAPLELEQARAAFEIMMTGNATPAQIGGFLMALRVRGETVDEITAGAMTLRAKAVTLEAPPGAIDIVGTGGDNQGTWNVSTAAALVVAGAGVPVAKHGNRAVSSKSGAADVLSALGVNIDCSVALVRKAMWDANIGFMLAPRYHGAMRHVGPARGELGTRTIFNLLGPLCNPAGVKRQLMGVFDAKWVKPLAKVLGKLGSEHVWVVHGRDGLDELTTTGPSLVAENKAGKLREFEVSPEDAGLPRASAADLRGGEPGDNATAIANLLDGHAGPFRDIVLYNAAAALVIAGIADDLKAGVAAAARSIDTAQARAALDQLVLISNEPQPRE